MNVNINLTLCDISAAIAPGSTDVDPKVAYGCDTSPYVTSNEVNVLLRRQLSLRQGSIFRRWL